MKPLRIKFADLSEAVPEDGDFGILADVIDVFQTGGYIKGKYNDWFSKQWADYCGTTHCIPCSSGSAALISIMRMFRKTRRGDYVITSVLSFAATAMSINHAGYTPIYCDTTEDGLVDLNQVEDAIRTFGSNVDIFLPVHLYGQLLDIPSSLLDKVVVMEDACQAHGAFRALQGAAAAFSFYPAKNLGAAGDAGAVVTNTATIAEYVKMFTNYGDRPGMKYDHAIIGDNLRMDEVQAAFLSAKMDRKFLEYSLAKRITVASVYEQQGIRSFARTMPHAYHLYPILVENPAEFMEYFQDKGIDTGNHYPYLQNAIVPGIHISDFHVARHICTHVLTLPIGPHMSVLDAEAVAFYLKEYAILEKGVWKPYAD